MCAYVLRRSIRDISLYGNITSHHFPLLINVKVCYSVYKICLRHDTFLFFTLGLSITCPEGFENHNSRCYKVLDVPSSWAEAKVYCSVIGGDLAIIDDANEHGIITGIIQRLHGSNDVHHWLDGSDVLAENEWRWMGHHGGSKPITYTKWNPGQPDNTDSAEHFLELSNFWHGAFNDMRGDVRRGFVCEAR
ncbi:hypothetical protein ACJMK2_002539 [Sinanodonta woodiana]|uniref:C-type lectin domain-containing protein n=1 Tax=Sinanodonta woodiana TaxID=1069815 RepID=A0ABD3XXF2_SINWO